MTTLGNLESLLEGAQISPSQARAYVAGLELGSATLADIIKRTGLSKTTAFEALSDLCDRKFARVVRRKKSVTYKMTDPEHAVSLLRSAVSEQAAMIDDLARAIPLFHALLGGNRPSTRIFEGADAIDGYFAHLEAVKPKTLDEIVHADDIYHWIDEKTLVAARKKYRWQPKSGRALFSGTYKNRNPIFVHRRLSPAWGVFQGESCAVRKFCFYRDVYDEIDDDYY